MYGFWHVDDDSWLNDLVSGRERWVVIRYELVDPTNSAGEGDFGGSACDRTFSQADLERQAERGARSQALR
jgi:hypothetical protein